MSWFSLNMNPEREKKKEVVYSLLEFFDEIFVNL